MVRAATAVGIAVLLLATALGAQANRRQFHRYVDAANGGRLEVCAARYHKGDARLVLFAAVHVADREHYAELQRRFAACDALLYELVADGGLRPYPGMDREAGRGDVAGAALELAQALAARGLGLAAQVDTVDYRPANFVHADLTSREWEDALARAGSSLLGELLAVGVRAERDPDAAPEPRVDLVAAFRSGRGLPALRTLVGRALGAAGAPPRRPTVILEGRNERCLEVLSRQLAAGRRALGVYYGAAHMPHLERRLVDDLGWTHDGDEWLCAWDNRDERFPTVPRDAATQRHRAWRERAARGPGPVARWFERLRARRELVARARAVTERSRAAFAGELAAFEQHLQRQRTRVADDVAALERLQARLAAERGAVAEPALQACFAHMDEAAARLRAAAVLAAARAHLAEHGVVPALAALRLDWLPGRGKDPWGNALRIVATDAGALAVHSDGPDGEPGTADDVVASPRE